MSNLFQVI